MKKLSVHYSDIRVIRVFIGTMLMSIMIPISLSGDALEDKYRGFMYANEASPSSKKNIAPKHPKEVRKGSTASVENIEEQGLGDKALSILGSLFGDTEEDIQVKKDKILTLKASKNALDLRIIKIDIALTKKVENQGLIRSLFNDTEEVDSLEDLMEELIEEREIIEKDIEILTEEIGELSE